MSVARRTGRTSMSCASPALAVPSAVVSGAHYSRSRYARPLVRPYARLCLPNSAVSRSRCMPECVCLPLALAIPMCVCLSRSAVQSGDRGPGPLVEARRTFESRECRVERACWPEGKSWRSGGGLRRSCGSRVRINDDHVT